MPVVQHLLCILAHQPLERGLNLVIAKGLCVFGQSPQIGRIDAAEVKETQRRTINAPQPTIATQRSLVQIPVSCVVACLTQNARTLGEARNKVHELLVHEDAAFGLAHAMVLESPGPPAQNALRLIASAHTEKAEVVDARTHDPHIVGKGCALGRLCQMGRENERSAFIQQPEDGLERSEHLDVRVEIDNLFVTPCQQMAEHERLDRRVELQHVVAKGKLAKVRNRQHVGSDHFAEIGIETGVRQLFIRKAQIDGRLGMMASRTLQQHPRHRDIVVRANRENRTGSGSHSTPCTERTATPTLTATPRVMTSVLR